MTHKNPQEERETAKQLHVQEPCGDGGTERQNGTSTLQPNSGSGVGMSPQPTI